MTTLFADMVASTGVDGTVDTLVQIPKRGDVPASLAGVVVGIKDGLVYVKPLTWLDGWMMTFFANEYVIYAPNLLEFATVKQRAQAGVFLARLASLNIRLDGKEWPPNA